MTYKTLSEAKHSLDRFDGITSAKECLKDVPLTVELLSYNWEALKKNKKDKRNLRSNPGFVSWEIEDIGEKAAQRAFFRQNRIRFSDHSIEWIDLEIPVQPGEKARRCCIDLRGIEAKVNRPILVEMKFANNKSPRGANSPLYALAEGLFYCASAWLYSSELEGICHRDEDISQRAKDKTYSVFPHLIVAANKMYWLNWCKKLGDQIFPNLFSLGERIQSSLPDGAWIKFASFPDIDFADQKSNHGKKNQKGEIVYKPFVSEGENQWDELTLQSYKDLLK